MDPKSNARVRKLPKVRHTWEIAAPSVAIALEDGGRIDRLLVVFGEGKIRLARPIPAGADPLEGLDKAFLEPTGGRPGIPAELRCSDEALAQALKKVLGSLTTVTVGPTPGVDYVAQQILNQLNPPPVPGIGGALALWRLVLDRFVALEPWEKLSDAVRFRFTGGDLDGSSAVFLGQREVEPGFAWFPTDRDFDRFLEAPSLSREEQDARSVQVHLQPADQLDEADRERCDQLGLTLGDRLPWVFATRGPSGETAELADQQLVLRALSAALELCAVAMPDLAAGRGHSAEVRAADARKILVEVEPAPEP